MPSAKTQISVGIQPVVGPKLHIKCTAKTDQTGQMPKLIWVFSGGTHHFVGFAVICLISIFFFFTLHSYHKSMKVIVYR